MMNDNPLFTGLAVGFSIAVPIGPMSLLCIQRTLKWGMRVGVSTGLGAATVNMLYGALAIAGMDEMRPLLPGGGRLLSFVGGLFLLWSAVRTLQAPRPMEDFSKPAVLSPSAAYGLAMAVSATSPASPILIVSLLSPLAGEPAPPLAGAAAILCGMFTAAATWWLCLCGSVTLLRSWLSPALLARVNQADGAMLTFYGALALARSAGM